MDGSSDDWRERAKDDSALSVNGKTKKLSLPDYLALGASLKIEPRALRTSFARLRESHAERCRLCSESGLSEQMRLKFLYILQSRFKRLFGDAPLPG